MKEREETWVGRKGRGRRRGRSRGAWCRAGSQDPGIMTWAKGRCFTDWATQVPQKLSFDSESISLVSHLELYVDIQSALCWHLGSWYHWQKRIKHICITWRKPSPLLKSSQNYIPETLISQMLMFATKKYCQMGISKLKWISFAVGM